MSRVHIYVDGSANNAKDNRVGGFGFAAVMGNRVIGQFAIGPFQDTNSGEMELKALRFALNQCKAFNWKTACIFSDSQYCVNGYNKWLDGWVKAQRSDIKFPYTWAAIHALKKELGSGLNVIWVKGHADNPFNNLVDRLANKGRKGESIKR